ncbi:hypothetical protein AVEN_26378-1 [Araneus ventricosus]|uniref:Uncharacterized protein n=1 Tax=Araneus ventricosus TaxID=182803 RepID=A0A4Y2R443_ARAVE|nr:hypothetical protein AVEN_26378-1 [Araneus ventricosus]
MLNFLVGDFLSNLVTMADVLNQLLGKFRDGWRDAAVFVERPRHVRKSPLNFSVQKPSSDEAVTRKAEAHVPSKVPYVRQEPKPEKLL